MIIKDIFGNSLSLTKTRLTEKTGMTVDHCYLHLADLFPKNTVKVVSLLHKGVTHLVGVGQAYAKNHFFIGCRYFDEKTFTKIMKAARQCRKARREAKAAR